jgi:hypothetical protein
MTLCNYKAAGSSFVCRACGDVRKRLVVRQCCGEVRVRREIELPAWFRCGERGGVVASTTGTVAGCGCGATVVEFYNCRHFREPVLKQCAGWAAESNREKLRAVCPGYAGRTCRECAVPLAGLTEHQDGDWHEQSADQH